MNPIGTSEEELNQVATMMCSCDEARLYQKISNAERKIDGLLLERYPKAAELSKNVVGMVARDEVADVTINTGMQMKIKISKNTKGEIKIKCTETYNNEVNI
jgi:hypothetical protein